MIKFLLPILFIINSSSIFCQLSYEIGPFISIYNNDFINHFNTFDEKPSYVPQSIAVISNQVPMASASAYYDENYGFHGTIMFTQILPESIRINDSIKMTLSGFNFRILRELFYWDPIDHFTVLTTVGVSAGRLKFWGDNRGNQKNQFIKPEIGVQPRILIGKIALSLNAYYGLDVSSGKWKKAWFNKTPQIELPRFTQGGLNIGISIGYALK